MIHFYSPIVASRKSLETRVDLDLLKQTCVLINTADYCQTTALEVFGSFDQLPGARIADVLISLKPRSRKRLIPSSKNKLHFRLNATCLSGNFSSFFSSDFLTFSFIFFLKARSRQRLMSFFGSSKSMSIHPSSH